MQTAGIARGGMGWTENAGPENGRTNLGSSQKVENAGPENK